MKTKKLLFATALLLSISFNNLNAQANEQIIKEILFDLFDQEKFGRRRGGDTILMLNTAGKVRGIWVDSTTVEMESGFRIPSEIFSEWEKNQEYQVEDKMWNEHYLNKIDTFFFHDGKPFISENPVFKLLSGEGVDRILSQTEGRQRIYAMSQIVFDDSGENAVFAFSVGARVMGLYRPVRWSLALPQQVIIKKVFGKWIILYRSGFPI